MPTTAPSPLIGARLGQGIADRLESLAPGSLRTRATDRLALAHDASHYLMTPTGVVRVHDANHLAEILRLAYREKLPVSFRSGGTSLSGQASTDGLLLDTRRHFRRIELLDDGDAVRVQPGATVRQVNARLLRHGRKLGPDPASEVACTLGGVIADNSSGMACGTRFNTYNTIRSAVLVLADGSVLDTAAPDADEQLHAIHPELWEGLVQLRDRVRGDADSVQTIRRQYSIKNTMGYGLNSFVDHDRPVDILLHLVVGSEGTLAFVADAVLDTLPVKTHAATGMLYFPTLRDATGALPALVASGLATIELLDATSLRVAQREPGADQELLSLDVHEHAALLVEYQESTADELQARLENWDALCAGLTLDHPSPLTRDPARRAALWHIRKDLYATVAGNRPSGTTALLEDVAVPVERLREACEGLIALFDKHGYEDSVIFGHAKDGNIHFMVTERFDEPDARGRAAAFTEDMVDLVLAHDGTLKAEHGTGRIMAPYVRRQFGDELYEVMREVKRLADPHGILGRGVLMNEDPDGPLSNLKLTPTVEEEVDRCVECGYCEPVCPSKDITLTPRQRIVLRRETERARQAGDTELVNILEKEYDYDGVQTCAVDGMCQTTCPVQINTGDLVRRLRAERQGTLSQAGWRAAASAWGTTSTAGGVALSAAHLAPPAATLATKAARTVLGSDTVPLYSADLPGGGKRRAVIHSPEPVAVYFSSCTTTMFGGVDGSVSESFLRLCERAGIPVSTPDDIPSLCCGTPWKSKGLTDGYEVMKKKVVASLLRASDGGRLPVVCDASSCTEGLRILVDAAADGGLRIVDAVAFVDENVLPLLPEIDRIPSLTLHPTCSSTHLGINPALQRVAEAAAETVVVPDDWGCCAFAGDRGMLHPELTASATAAEAREVADAASAAHASLNRTCELGMTRATGQDYRHILQVLDDALG